MENTKNLSGKIGGKGSLKEEVYILRR